MCISNLWDSRLTLAGLHDQSETGRDGLAGLLSLNHFEGLGGVVGGWEVGMVVEVDGSKEDQKFARIAQEFLVSN